MLRALTATSVEQQLYGRWIIAVAVYDDDGNPALETTPVLTLTDPDGTSTNPAMTQESDGTWKKAFTVDLPGLYVAKLEAPQHDALAFATYVRPVTLATELPDVAAVRDYSSDDLESWDDPDIQAALDTELEAQVARCGVRAIRPAPLNEALMRRVIVNLAKRSLILPGLTYGDAEIVGTPSFIPGRDNEINRLEAPYLKVVLI